MDTTAHIYIVTTKSKLRNDGRYPVKICVTHKRDQRYYSIREWLETNEWESIDPADIDHLCITKKIQRKNGDAVVERKIYSPPADVPRKFKPMIQEFARIVGMANNIIKKLGRDFTFAKFEGQFFKQTTEWDKVFPVMTEHIAALKSDGRFGYASSFECAMNSMKGFTKDKPVLFMDITPDWLKRYERHMNDKGLSKATQGIYVRNIRVLFGIVKKHITVSNPFSDGEHKPKKSPGRKLALTADQLQLIATYESKSKSDLFYRDIFMFSFMANGMNIADIARLKKSDIRGDEIEFVREKTKNEDGDETIRVPIHPEMQSIMNRHKNPTIGHDAYIFPLLKPGMTDEQCFKFIRGFTSNMNKGIKRIAKKVDIVEKVSTYTARHSFATIAKNSGLSIEYIKEALGHSNVAVTEAYLKQFEKSTRREHSETVVNAVYKNKAG